MRVALLPPYDRSRKRNSEGFLVLGEHGVLREDDGESCHVDANNGLKGIVGKSLVGHGVPVKSARFMHLDFYGKRGVTYRLGQNEYGEIFIIHDM